MTRSASTNLTSSRATGRPDQAVRTVRDVNGRRLRAARLC
jgi:hypothetical protein